MIERRWPLGGLAVIQVIDAALCRKPVSFIAGCLDDVHFPRRLWPILPPLKFAAAAGLLIGIRFKPLAVLTAGCLIGYFVVAIGMHARARDFGRNLFVNALGMLVLCTSTFGVVVRSKSA